MTAPTDRTAEAYRARIRALAETKRQPRPERRPRHRDPDAPGRRPYPWTVDSVDIGATDD